MGCFLPRLEDIQTVRDMIGDFRGYNHNSRINDNEFFDMRNMSSDLYPLLSPRTKRGKVRQFNKPNGLFFHDRLCWVDGTDFYYDGKTVGTVSDTPKQFVKMGAYVLIWPDKVYYNTATDEFGCLEQVSNTIGAVSITLCKLDGTAYQNYTSSDTAPPDPTDGQLWVDSSSTPHVLKQFSSSYGTWVSIATTYVKISSTGIGSGFSEYDGVTISGMNNTDLNGNFIMYSVGDDYIVIAAIIDAAHSQTNTVTVKRMIPDMDYITESENRLWGCSSKNHEIYACVLGDPKNWHRFLGIATDSYTMTVGSGGDFTGCCTHLGYVLFFKADVIHKIYGNKPSNFQITNTNCRGVEKGSEKSLAIVNETLYYKSRRDVCAYNSSLPAAISTALGNAEYKEAVAGSCGSKYYISMKGKKDSVMFVFDEMRGLWHKEDNIYASCFASVGSDLYFINESDNCLYSINGNITDYADEHAELEGDFGWFVETGDIGLDMPDNKYVSKLQVRLEVEAFSIVRISVQYNDDMAWEEKYRINFSRKKSFTAPIIPRRCDTMRIRLSGKGSCRIYSLTKTIEQGSEM